MEKMLTIRSLRLAGRLSFVSATLAVPLLLMAFEQGSGYHGVAGEAQLIFYLCGTGIFVYLMKTLKRFLNQKAGFHAADRLLDLMIAVNLISATTGIVASALPDGTVLPTVFAGLVMVAGGTIQVLLGLRLMRLGCAVTSLYRKFCWLNIATGASVATLVLLPLGVLISAVADIMLGTIFMEAAKEMEKTGVVGVGAGEDW